VLVDAEPLTGKQDGDTEEQAHRVPRTSPHTLVSSWWTPEESPQREEKLRAAEKVVKPTRGKRE